MDAIDEHLADGEFSEPSRTGSLGNFGVVVKQPMCIGRAFLAHMGCQDVGISSNPALEKPREPR